RAATALVRVGVFAFSALIVLLTYAPDLRSDDNGGGHALSRSALGYAGLVELMKLEGQTVVVSRARLAAGHTQGLLVTTPNPDVEEKDLKALGFGGPTLVVLPKWLGAPDAGHRGWVSQAQIIDPKFLKPPM